MKSQVPRTQPFVLITALIFAFSFWLRASFPVFAVGWAGHDDALFIKLAAWIGQGSWLGDYNNLTHAKGVGYPLFLIVNHVVDFPLKFSEHVIYLSAALCFATMIGRIFAKRSVALILFALLAFVPTAWNPAVGGRVVREGLYVSLTLFLLFIVARCFVENMRDSVRAEMTEKRWLLILLGLIGGCYWLTREEGVWLLPSIAILCAYWLMSRRWTLTSARHAALFFGLPILSMAIFVGAVNSINYYKYGVFRNNDFRSVDFQAGYGALARIKHDNWQRYVVFPKDARERAYRLSAAARELRPTFEGQIGESWRRIGCTQTRTEPCPEILSGWFMWALRDAVAAAGHYRSAQDAQAFYLRLAAEIDAGCRQYSGECLPYRETMVPPWRDHYLMDTIHAVSAVFKTLITIDGAPVGIGSSLGTPKQLGAFALATNGPIAPPEHQAGAPTFDPELVSPRDTFRLNFAKRLAKAVKAISEIGIPAALIGWIAWIALALWRRELPPGLVLASAMVAAVVSRVTLLGFLEATSIPSNYMLYLMPVLPIALALIPTVLFGLLGCLKRHTA